jgi:LAO/AO transport system kinase
MKMKYTKAKNYIDGIINKDRLALSRTITLIESTLPQHQELAQEIISRIMPYTGNSIRLGITGVPGVGKSTFIEELGMFLVEDSHKVAVLAIDPSSTVSGGSILADKTRMEFLSYHKNAFIRPSPSGNYLGGVAQKTRETMLLCEAAGYDAIIIETVGVGQSEITVASMVDFFLVLMLANAGDELQGIKKGILEVADGIAINKADKKHLQQALLAQKVYENAMHILKPSSSNWSPPVLTCSATEKTGISEVWDMIVKHNNILKKSGELDIKRKKQAISWMWNMIEDGIKKHFINLPEVKNIIPNVEKQVKKSAITPTRAAKKILDIIIKR